jgi:tRNA threonylcarbamoyladenosine biosynthesis protein TsaB
MPLILHIDTAVQASSICLADGEEILGVLISPSEKESASWLHVAIKGLMEQTDRKLQHLNAIAISAGPGSYTGLRVGMATAKGLCYALSIPLISINTLQMMAASVSNPQTKFLCPMIDARRMEVFTALYDQALNEIMPSTPLILEETSFQEWLPENNISFFGNGSTKAKFVIKHPNAFFIVSTATAASMVKLAAKKFDQNQVSNLTYKEPFYGKDLHLPISKRIY